MTKKCLPSEISTIDMTQKRLGEIKRIRRTDCNENILGIDDVWFFMVNRPDIKVFFDIKYYDTNTGIGVLDHINGHFQEISSQTIGLVMEKIARQAKNRALCHRIGFVTFYGGRHLLRTAKEFDNRITTALIVILPHTKILPNLKYLDLVIIGWQNFNQWKLFPQGLKRIIKEIRESGLKFHGGIANTKDEVQWLLSLGADGIWTDNAPGN